LQEAGRLLQYDATEVKSIVAQLKDMSKDIAEWTSESTNPLFDVSLFKAAGHTLDPIAHFPDTVDGIARFSDAVGLSIRVINTPLKKVFHKPLVGNPISTPEIVSAGVIAIVERIREYFADIDRVVSDVDALVLHLDGVSSDALLIPKGIEEFASAKPGDSPVDAGTAKKAWREASSAAEGFISTVIGKTSAAKLMSSM
jgi:hypothetical protein